MTGLGFSQETIDAIEWVKTGKTEGYVSWHPEREGVSFAPFVEEDTKESPGRYVPAIGKRLVM